MTMTLPAQRRPAVGNDRADELAALAVSCVRDEALLTPKPGLVDRRGSGAHTDMSLHMLLSSADALRPAFTELAVLGGAWPGALTQDFRDEVGVIGRSGEAAMLAATGGVNTHRGALWAVGLLVVAAARGAQTEQGLTGQVARLAAIPDSAVPGEEHMAPSHGENARRHHGVRGARGQAVAGLPAVREAIRALRDSRTLGHTETDAQLIALLTVMSVLDDTCLIHRGGLEGLHWFQRRASVLLARTVATPDSWDLRARLTIFDHRASVKGLSPGGSADLLAAALFIDRFLTSTAQKD